MSDAKITVYGTTWCLDCRRGMRRGGHLDPRLSTDQVKTVNLISRKRVYNNGMRLLTLNTQRLILRYFHILDDEAMVHIFGDAEVMHFGDGVQSRERVVEWLRNCIDHHYQSWGFGPYAVVEKSSGNVIGYCGLFFFPDIGGQAEIELGYRLARPAWGKGYATEAARAVCEFAFTSLGIRRLIAMIDPANLASIRVAEKIGMQYEKEIMFEGYTHSDHVYAIALS